MKPPLVSVVTTTDRPQLLDDGLGRLLGQSFADWEWVVVLSDGARWRPVAEDPRVRIVVEDGELQPGAGLRLACSVALGEVLVPLGADDLLTADALGALAEAFDAHPQCGVVYGDVASIGLDGAHDPGRRAAEDGWTYREEPVEGTTRAVLQWLEPFPHNVSDPRYAPGPLLAFRRSAYAESGGYDPGAEALAQEDLVCRLYQHSEFLHLPRCLYIERRRVPSAAAEARGGAFAVYERHVQPNALAWAARNGLLALDMGAAHNKAPGYLGVDQYPGEGVDIVGDVTKGIDLPDSCVGVIRAVDFLEHIEDRVAMFNELYRILAHGGMLLSLTPSTDGRGAFQDPTHVAPYNENSFWYFTDRDYARFVPPITCRFQVSALFTFFLSEWHQQHGVPYVCANLVAVKDGPRQGGPLHV